MCEVYAYFDTNFASENIYSYYLRINEITTKIIFLPFLSHFFTHLISAKLLSRSSWLSWHGLQSAHAITNTSIY
jgi:hypothetical protein